MGRHATAVGVRWPDEPDIGVSTVSAVTGSTFPTSGTAGSGVPAPGAAPLVASSAAVLLRRNGTDPVVADRPAVRFGDHVWTHAELLAESERFAELFLSHRSEGSAVGSVQESRPTHVGILADNIPEYLFALGGAALSGSTLVGLNHTRTGTHLLRDISHTDCDVILTEPRHLGALSEIDLGSRPVLVTHRWDDGPGEDLDDALTAAESNGPWELHHEPQADDRWALIFTSGTSGAPKAVICTQRRLLVTGKRMSMLMDLGPSDIGYVCMPLFHSNALMVGWAPSVVVGASVALARRFSASGWLPDVRRYGATWFNYTGKPLSYLVATEERSDDADNPVRIAFGNEGSPQVLDTFRRRFDVEVIDAFGSTEGAIAVNRDVPTRPGAMGVAGPGIRIVDAHGAECPSAEFDRDGTLVNAAQCVGEIVNTAGAGPFEGYYNNVEATAAATRDGWYWSGDLGYLDADRALFFAGRTADWIRVDGENFPAGPIADALAVHPDVVVAAVYGVPDTQAGDQVMAAVVLRSEVSFDGAAFAAWVDSLPDVGPKWRPRFVRVATELPGTGTNKIVTRTLQHQHVRGDRVGDDQIWFRERSDPAYRLFTAADEADRLRDMTEAGRARFWDL